MNNDYMSDDPQAQVRNDTTQIMEESFSLNALITIGLVRQIQNKSYKSPFFFYFGASPAGKRDEQGNTPYIRQKGITIAFKLETGRMYAMGKAIQTYADLAFKGWCAPPRNQWMSRDRKPGIPYCHLVWADPSKTQNANEQESNVSGKNVFVTVQPDAKNPGNNLVIICFNRGKDKGGYNGSQGAKDNFPSITVTLQPFEAMSLASSIFYMVDKARAMSLTPAARHFMSNPGQRSAPAHAQAPQAGSGNTGQQRPAAAQSYQTRGAAGQARENTGQQRPAAPQGSQTRQPAPQAGSQGGQRTPQNHAYAGSTYQRKGFGAAA